MADAKQSVQPVRYANGSNVGNDSDDEIDSVATITEAWIKAFQVERDRPKEEARREILALTDQINATTDPTELAELYFSRGHEQSIVEDREQAVRDFFAALDRATERPQIIRIKIMISLELLMAKETQEASLSWAVDAVNDDVGNADAWDNLGLVSGICGYYGFAIDALRRAIELQPDHPSATLRLGLYLREKGNYRSRLTCLARTSPISHTTRRVGMSWVSRLITRLGTLIVANGRWSTIDGLWPSIRTR